MLKTPLAAEGTKTEWLSINTIRTLAMDAVEAAKSGHPGTPMALAPVAYQLWNRVLRYDPDDPFWPNRDRFVLSCGHASMLLYALLHLAQVKQIKDGKQTGELAVPLDHIKQFRQLHSRCPGHPEQFETTGVETTTGPLGQGISNSVGMAIAERWLAAHFNRPGFELFDYDVYAMCSDGDLMEGVGVEAASLAGRLKLSNLCWIYDDNNITIEGHADLAFAENVGQKFEGLGWHVIHVADANDLQALAEAYAEFHKIEDRPTLIIVRSVIAFGAPKAANTHQAHGAPLGEEEIRATKAVYGWPVDAKFLTPPEALRDFADNLAARGKKLANAWRDNFAKYAKQYPELAVQWHQIEGRDLPDGWDRDLPVFPADPKGVATRVTGGKALNAVAKNIPWLLGGSADLAPSTLTTLLMEDAGQFGPGSYGGRNFHFGIREHGMAAMLNGLAVSGLRPFGSTFFVFSDYLRPSMRLSALMQLPVLYIFTHDSIGVGEDGPTHQPIEHLAAARAIPQLIVMRPGDANEVTEAYRAVMPIKNRPVAMILTRQNLPTLDRSKYAAASGVSKGAYILADAKQGKPDLILMATGSELYLAVEAYEKLTAAGKQVRVVSFPSWQLFESQSAEYRASVLPKSTPKRIAIEAGVQQGWEKYLGDQGRFIGMHGFGASAPFPVLAKHFGLTTDHVMEVARELLG